MADDGQRFLHPAADGAVGELAAGLPVAGTIEADRRQPFAGGHGQALLVLAPNDYAEGVDGIRGERDQRELPLARTAELQDWVRRPAPAEPDPPAPLAPSQPLPDEAAGRGMGTQIKTADKKSMSSIQWIKRQLADPWSEKARAEGWRSRAAFKFSEIDDRFRLVRKGSRVIDLGAAPGGWVQVCVNRGAEAVVGVDLLPIEPIPGSTLIQADFTDPGVDQQLIEALGGPPDLVLSDMAHNTVGHRQTDHLKIIALIEIAADFAIRTLRPGGHFVTKNFQGGDAGHVLADLRAAFQDVKYVKPSASRKGSSEVYLVALNRK